MTKTHYPYPKIRHFKPLAEYLVERAALMGQKPPIITYCSKVKLHGSNTSVVIDWNTGDVTAQSRTTIRTQKNDMCGFAAWVDKNKDDLRNAFLPLRTDANISVFYGEWCGRGVQRGVAISGIPERSWFLFGMWNDVMNCYDHEVTDHVPEMPEINFYNTGSTREITVIDFSDSERYLTAFAGVVDAIEAECPIAARFGIKGLGEGRVFYPLSGNDEDLLFKIKGKLHKAETKKYTKEKVEKFQDAKAFADKTCTDDVMEKIYLFENLSPSIAVISTFLRETGEYIWTTRQEEIYANDLERKDVMRAVQKKAKRFFINKVNEAKGEKDA